MSRRTEKKKRKTVPAEALTIKFCSLIMVTSLILSSVSSSVDLEQQFFAIMEQKYRENKRVY